MNTQEYIEGKQSKRFDFSKPTKEKALELLEQIEKSIESGEPNGYVIGRHISELFRFFAPKDTAKTVADDPEKWALQAVSKDVTRHNLNTAFIHGDRKELAATDGRRLHLVTGYTQHADGGILPDGAHLPESEREKEYGTFPGYQRVIPPETTERIGLVWTTGPGTGKNATRDTVIAGLPTRILELFYKEATAGMKNPRFWMSDCLTPLLIKDAETNRLAVIMPIRCS
jgi:hypothetical protein